MPDLDANLHSNRLAGVRTGGGVGPADVLAVLRNLDLVLLPVGVALALALGAPAFGVLVGAGGWLLQRALALLDRRLNFVDAFARIWLLAGAIVAAGAIGGRSDGLAAAVLIFGAYSLAFAVRLARGRSGGPG